MRTILYLGSTTDLDYERELLREWDKTCVHLATCTKLPAHASLPDGDTGAEAAAPATEPAMPDPLCEVDAVVVEQGELNADVLRAHPQLTVVVLLDDKHASADVAAATAESIWVTRAQNRALLRRLHLAPQTPGRSARRHALQDALAGIAGERPSGRINEL